MKHLLLSTVCIVALSAASSASAAVADGQKITGVKTDQPIILVAGPTVATPTATDIVKLSKQFTLGKDNQILNSAGQVTAHYNPVTGAVTNTNGTPIKSPVEIALFKQVYTNGKAAEAITTAAGGYKLGTDNQILNAAGQVAAKYNPTTGQFASLTGSPIDVSTKEYSMFKAAISQAQGSNALTNKVGTEVLTAQNKAVADTNAVIRDIGGGFSVNSRGVITATGTNNPVALVDSVGNVVGLNGQKLDVTAQTALNKLMKGISLPSGFGLNDRVDPRIIQKNLYAAKNDDGSIYYGDSGFVKVDTGAIAGAIVKAATDKNPTTTSPTTTTASDFTIRPGSNQITNPNGVVVATYDASTGQFRSPTGAVIGPDNVMYQAYKSALAASFATATPVARTKGTATADLR